MSISKKGSEINPEGVIEEEIDLRELSRVKKQSGLIFSIIMAILIATGAFGMGLIVNLESNKPDIWIENIESHNIQSREEGTKGIVEGSRIKRDSSSSSNNLHPTSTYSNERVVGSVNSNKFHLESCPGAKQIKNDNLIVFDSIDDAIKRGYTKALNCKPLESI